MTSWSTDPLFEDSASLDSVTFAFALISSVSGLFQVRQLWVQKTAGAVSFWAWFAGGISNVCWILYGFAHGDSVLLVSSVVSCMIQFIVVSQVAYYTVVEKLP